MFTPFPLRFLLLAFVPLALTDCVPVKQGGATAEKFGETTGPRSSIKVCVPEAKALPVSSAYLQRLFAHVASKNPNTFKGLLAPKNFCLSVVPSEERNAYANPENGSIRFHSPLIMEATDDSYMAAWLGHELAHITKNHGVNFSVHNLPKRSATDAAAMAALTSKRAVIAEKEGKLFPEFKKLLKPDAFEDPYLSSLFQYLMQAEHQGHVDQHVRDFLKHVKAAKMCATSCDTVRVEAILREFGALYIEVKPIQRQLQDLQTKGLSKEQLAEMANGREREADEVGLEFFARAGFSIPLYGLVATKTLRDDENFESCALDSNGSAKKAPERGMQSHPLPCWRMQNYLTTWVRDNAKSLSSYFQNTMRNLPPGKPTLQEAQAEIRGIK